MYKIRRRGRKKRKHTHFFADINFLKSGIKWFLYCSVGILMKQWKHIHNFILITLNFSYSCIHSIQLETLFQNFPRDHALGHPERVLAHSALDFSAYAPGYEYSYFLHPPKSSLLDLPPHTKKCSAVPDDSRISCWSCAEVLHESTENNKIFVITGNFVTTKENENRSG